MFKKINVVLLLVMLSVSCSNLEQQYAEIEKASNNYDELIEKSDANGIADIYTKDGIFTDRAKGRDSIRAFIERSKHIQVLEHASTTLNIHIEDGNATQEGVYNQTAVIMGDTVKTEGKFTTEWTREEGRWRIRKLTTRPIF